MGSTVQQLLPLTAISSLPLLSDAASADAPRRPVLTTVWLPDTPHVFEELLQLAYSSSEG